MTLLGQLRSFNNRSGIGRRLVLSVFARSLVKSPGAEIKNHIRLCGAVCKPPVLRSTPLGREICDLLLAVNRRCGRSDYLPVICWGLLAGRRRSLPPATASALRAGSRAGVLKGSRRRNPAAHRL
ncbi:MAG: hypothetical protein ACLUNQ_04535 [Oscillospiraceae bacterium]